MTKVEEVARAICEADCGCITANELARCMGLARAAIEAMRVPTQEMVEASDSMLWERYGVAGVGVSSRCLETMITVAINTPASGHETPVERVEGEGR